MRLSLLICFLMLRRDIADVKAFSPAPAAYARLSARQLRLHQALSRNEDKRAEHLQRFRRNASLGTTVEIVDGEEYLKNKEALKKDLRHEYASFFEDFASERYLPDVEFIDPVTSFTGLRKYKDNVDMLGGRSVLGRVLFKDASIALHQIEEPGPFQLRTRWTLAMCFNALPWKPVGQFTGVSEYTLDGEARIVKQVDYWDSINLIEGRYRAVSPLEGVKDFVAQVLPGRETRKVGGSDGVVGDLLRRAKEYEVRLFQAGGGEHGASSGLITPEVVASRDFDGDATAEEVAENSRILLQCLRADGLNPGSSPPRIVSPGTAKAHQVTVALQEHDWLNADVLLA